MALHDLTPQLRTRLGRMERAVGIFVALAATILLAGFGYYLYHTAHRKGWFVPKVRYSTSLNNAAGLKIGDPVKLMGFTVGEITKIEANSPEDYYNVTVYFAVRKPYFGYVWTDSKVKAAAADFLGNRYLELVKGKSGVPTVFYDDHSTEAVLKRETLEASLKERISALLPTLQETNRAPALALDEVRKAALQNPGRYYVPNKQAAPYWVEPLESPAVTERLEQVVNLVEQALPNILNLTNQLSRVLHNAEGATASLDTVLQQSRPLMTNLTLLSSSLNRGPGSLGEWLIPTNLHAQLEKTVASADRALTRTDHVLAGVDTNLLRVVDNLSRSLDNLASLTSNLNQQVQMNTNILTEVSRAIVHSDELVQGLKRHWLLRSAFKTPRTNQADKASTRSRQLTPPKDRP